ncbi:hypothetical protein JCM5353_001591 [Sporobolomyces roseus]
MGIRGLWSTLEEVGGSTQWEIAGKRAEAADSAGGGGGGKKAKGVKRTMRSEDERKKWIEDWISKHRDEEKEWIANVASEEDAIRWLTRRREKLGLGDFDKVGVDLGQLGQSVENLERRLAYRLKIGQLNKNQVRERYVTGYLRLLNALLSRLRRVLGQQIRPCCAFDDVDARDELKKEAELVRLLPQVVSATQSRYLELERQKVKDLAKASNEGRRKKSEDEKLRRDGARPGFPALPLPNLPNLPLPSSSATDDQIGLPVVIDTLEEEWEGIVEEMAGPEIEMASEEGGGGGSSASGDQMGGSEGARERERGCGDAAESDESSHAETSLFPSFGPIDAKFIASLPDTLYGRLAREEALTFLATSAQAIAKTECDYLLPTYLDSDTLAEDDRVLRYISSNPPLQPPINETLTPSSSPSSPARLAYSQDGDLAVAVDHSLCDFIWSITKLNGKWVHRLVDVKGMYAGMKWRDRFVASGHAAIAGNDYTGGGVPNAGIKTMRNNDQPKFANLRHFARSAQGLLQARDHFLTPSAQSPTSFNAGTFTFKSLEQMETRFDSVVEPFYTNSSSTTKTRITLDRWLNSIKIQAGEGSSGKLMSKKEVKKQLEDEAIGKMEKARKECEGTKPTPAVPQPSQPRQHQLRSISSSSHSLSFDAPPTLEKGGAKSYRTTGNFNGPTLLAELKEENKVLMEFQAKNEASAGDDKPPKKKSRKGKERATDQEQVEVEEDKMEIEVEIEKVEVQSKGKGKGKAKAKEIEKKEEEEDENEEKASRSRFPTNLHGKTATLKKFASSSVFNDLAHADLDPNLPRAFECFFAWIRQFGIIEMPDKVSLIQRVLIYYSLFAPGRLKKIINGGNEFTKWTEGVLSRRKGYEEWLDSTRFDDDQTLATLDEIRPYLLDAKSTLSVTRQNGLEELVMLLGLRKKKELGYLGADGGTQTTDLFIYLAAFDHANAGLDCPLLIDSHFDSRNLVNYGTSISNSSRSEARQLDWILAKLLAHFPSYLVIDYRATPFDVPNDSVRRSFSNLGDDGHSLLSLLPTSSLTLRRIRECIATTPIRNIPSPDPLPSKLGLLRSQLPTLLFDVVVSPSALRGDRPISTKCTEAAVAGVVDFIVAAVEWIIQGLRVWVLGVNKGLDKVTTLGDWIVSAGGEERVNSDEEWKRKKEKKKGNGGKSGKKGKDKSADLNGDEEVADKANVALVELKVLAASFRELRHRPFRFSPNMIFVNLEILHKLALNANFEIKMILLLQRIAMAVERQNSSMLLKSDLPLFEVDVPPKNSNPLSSKRSSPTQISSEFLHRQRHDSTLERQTQNKDKIVYADIHECKGIEFDEDKTGGAILVQRLGTKGQETINTYVAAIAKFFKKTSLKANDIMKVSVFVMDLIFKRNFGQLLPTGDIGISTTHYHLGVVDHRKRERSFVKKMSAVDRSKPASALLLEAMNSDAKLSPLVNKLFSKFGGLEVIRQERVPIPELEREDKVEERQQVNDFYKMEKEDHEQEVSRGESTDVPLRIRQRRLPRFLNQTEPRGSPFQPRFPLVGATFTIHHSSTRNRLCPPPRDSPIQVYERKPPHLLMSGVPEDAHELDRPSQAVLRTRAFFDEAEVEGAPTRPAVIADDAGQYYAQARSKFDLVGDTSVRHYHKQKPFAVKQRENAQVAGVLAHLSPNARLNQALRAPGAKSTENIHKSTRIDSVPTELPQSLNLPLPLDSDAPTTMVPFVFPTQLSKIEPILQRGMNSRKSHLSTLRSEEVQSIDHQRLQKDASYEVRDLFGKSSPTDTPQSVLYLANGGGFPSGGRFGPSKTAATTRALDTALHSSPGLKVTTVTVGEGFTSSVCPDPRCRASLLRPCRHAAPSLSPLNRVKYCSAKIKLDNRDGLAGANIVAIAFQLSHGFKQNPLSLELALNLGRSLRFTKRQTLQVEKLVGKVLLGKNVQECEVVLAKLGESETAKDFISLLKTMLQGGEGDAEDESGDEEGQVGRGEGFEEEDDDDELGKKKKRKKARRVRGRGKGKTVNYDLVDPIFDDA